jgi:mRNA interferase RelE/StbE
LARSKEIGLFDSVPLKGEPANPIADPSNSREATIFAGLTAYQSGYNLAKMPFEIVLAPEAIDDFKGLKANARADVRVALETHLRHEPKKVSRSRIKRLRGLRKPQYRLRVGEVRIFYDVTEATVEVLAIVAKLEADAWLAQFAKPV